MDDQSDTMNRVEERVAVCASNKGYPASLILRKVYQIIPDEKACRLGQIRVVDESGEDYLYPEGYFVPVQLSDEKERSRT